MRTLFGLTISGTLLVACGGASEPQTSKPAAVAASASASAPTPVASAAVLAVEIQTGSPDQAVKTWWRYLDALEVQQTAECQTKKTSPEILQARAQLLSRVSGGELLLAHTPKYTCIQEVFAREIDEVKVESETRAVVFAKVKNVTPIPAGGEMDDYDKKWRTNGFKFKYLVEKFGGEWKVSQVYRWDDAHKILNREPWEKRYVYSDKPSVPSQVHLP